MAQFWGEINFNWIVINVVWGKYGEILGFDQEKKDPWYYINLQWPPVLLHGK